MSEIEHKINRRRVRSSYISVVISMTLVLFMIGMVGVMLLGVREVIQAVKEKSQTYVATFKEDAKDTDIELFNKKISQQDFALNVEYTNRQKALEEARELMSSKDDPFYNETIFPPSTSFSLPAKYAEKAKTDSILNILLQSPVVESVKAPDTGLDFTKIQKNIRQAQIAMMVIAGIFLLIAIILINNAIRLNIYSKRFSIKTMQLIGAERFFIQKPFLNRAIIVGFISGILAIGAIAGLLYFLGNQPEDLYLYTQKINTQYLYILYGGLLVLGILISVISTYWATSKYLKLRTDQLYY